MLLTTQDRFEDHTIGETLGLIRGNTIRARHLGKDILASLRNIVGGEVAEYTKMMAEAREQALDRMVAAAETQNADGIVGIRFTSATVMSGAAEIVVYGTAVKFK
jgi:uncharacterized protein YbjQ (UPF0145 family)